MNDIPTKVRSNICPLYVRNNSEVELLVIKAVSVNGGAKVYHLAGG